jgi:hypothetical protein
MIKNNTTNKSKRRQRERQRKERKGWVLVAKPPFQAGIFVNQSKEGKACSWVGPSSRVNEGGPSRGNAKKIC